MTRQEFIQAVQRELGRDLTPEEVALAGRIYESNEYDARPASRTEVVAAANAVKTKDEPTSLSTGAQSRAGAATQGRQGGRSFEGMRSGAPGGTDEYKPGDASLRQKAYEYGELLGMTRAEVDSHIRDLLGQVQINQQIAENWNEAENGPLPAQYSTDFDSFFETYVGSLQSAYQQSRGAPIGVPGPTSYTDPITGERVTTPGFVASRFQGVAPADRKFVGGAPGFDREVEPRYFTGDQYSPAGRPPEQIAQIQKRMVEAGLLEEGAYYAGFWDTTTSSAYEAVLGWANQSGRTADEALDYLVDNVPESIKEARNRAKLAKQFQAPAYVKPDYATLAQDTKSYMRSKLGRDPTDQEMAQLTAAMSGAYRSDYEAEVARMRAEWDAQQQGLETGEAVTPVSVIDVDPVARFRQLFDERFGAEMDFIEGQEDYQTNVRNAMSSIGAMTRLIG